jgi:hypothetical protein
LYFLSYCVMDDKPPLLVGNVDKFNGIIIDETSLPSDQVAFEHVLVGSYGLLGCSH